MNNFICDGCGKTFPMKDIGSEINTPNLSGIVMCKYCIAESKLKEFLNNQQDLDPEFQKIIDDNFWELVSGVPNKERFKTKL